MQTTFHSDAFSAFDYLQQLQGMVNEKGQEVRYYDAECAMNPNLLSCQGKVPMPFEARVPLMNLITDVDHYHGAAGSDTYFDYRRGDPTAASSTEKYSKDAGHNLHFIGSTGSQEAEVVGKFYDSASENMQAARDSGSRNSKIMATADLADVAQDRRAANEHRIQDNQSKVSQLQDKIRERQSANILLLL